MVTLDRSPVNALNSKLWRSACAHRSKKLFKVTARALNAKKLIGSLCECEGLMVTKVIRAPVAMQTSICSDWKFERMFVDLKDEEEFPTLGGGKE